MRLSAIGVTVLLFVGPALPAPDDLEDAHRSLQEAQSKKDAALVKKLAAQTCALARKEISAPAPEGDNYKEAWTKRVTYARGVELHTEYALYATAVQGPPAITVELLSALEEQNPKSKYLEEAYARYFLALNQTGASAKILAVAEKAIAQFPDNEDLLRVLADTALSRKQNDRALRYASHLIAVLGKHPKPEGISAADWQRKRNASLGRGYWIAGIVQSEQNKYSAADKALRAALPLVEGDEGMMAAALFHLGLVNYQLGRLTNSRPLVLDAAKFSDRAAAMKSPYAQQAWRNAHIMRTEALKMR
jgi:tetratricopeptide (TPR) repeat protein